MTNSGRTWICEPSDRQGLGRLLNTLEERLAERYPDSPCSMNARLVAEELLVNCLEYGSAGDQPAGRLRVGIEAGADSVNLRIEDPGRPWNPLEHAAPEVEAEIEDRPIGGLGMFLVNELTTTACYERDGDYNVVVLTLAITPEESRQ